MRRGSEAGEPLVAGIVSCRITAAYSSRPAESLPAGRSTANARLSASLELRDTRCQYQPIRRLRGRARNYAAGSRRSLQVFKSRKNLLRSPRRRSGASYVAQWLPLSNSLHDTMLR